MAQAGAKSNLNKKRLNHAMKNADRLCKHPGWNSYQGLSFKGVTTTLRY
jgi:hypothetical protein